MCGDALEFQIFSAHMSTYKSDHPAPTSAHAAHACTNNLCENTYAHAN